MSISTAFFHIVYLLSPGDNLKNTYKPYIYAIMCLLSSHFISKKFLLFIQLSYSDSRVSLSILVSVRELPLASSMNETCTARVFSSPDIHISSFWIQIKHQVILI